MSGFGTCCDGQTYVTGGLYTFDAKLRGDQDESAAELSLPGETYGRWNSLLLHDVDGDGVPELMEHNGLLAAYRLPLTDAVAEVEWRGGSGDGLSATALGDVTGDGLPDLAAFDLELPDEDRAGVLFIVPGGEAGGGPIERMTTQIHGGPLGDAMGWSSASADIDGGGVLDLVVGASGVWPGVERPGRVLVFRGPVSGVLTEEDAIAVVYGEHMSDMFGRSIGVTDVDHDAKADLVIGAQGYPLGASDGRVYVVPGKALVP